jgi:hypothetical protein
VREPFIAAAYDLQSRLYNILCQEFLYAYSDGNEREKHYAENHTVFCIAQYFCWSEIVRKDIQYINIAKSTNAKVLTEKQSAITHHWATDVFPSNLRIFAGEQRAIGEALIHDGDRGLECIGYGAFLKTILPGVEPLIDVLREDVRSLSNEVDTARERLSLIQNALSDLLDVLDPQCRRFSKDRRLKVEFFHEQP